MDKDKDNETHDTFLGNKMNVFIKIPIFPYSLRLAFWELAQKVEI